MKKNGKEYRGVEAGLAGFLATAAELNAKFVEARQQRMPAVPAVPAMPVRKAVASNGRRAAR